MGWIGVETNGGAALMGQWAAGSETLYILGATVGSGYVAEANMRTATALQSEKANAAIVESIKITNGVKLRVRVSPASSAAYTAHEIGIWAKLGANGTRTLIQLHQDAATGIDVPTATASPEFVFDLICPMVVSNSGSLSITIDTSVYVSNGQFAEERAINRLLAESLPGCTATPTFDSDGNLTGITHVDELSVTKRTDVFSRTSTAITEVRTLDSGEVLTITTTLATKATSYVFS